MEIDYFKNLRQEKLKHNSIHVIMMTFRILTTVYPLMPNGFELVVQNHWAYFLAIFISS